MPCLGGCAPRWLARQQHLKLDSVSKIVIK
jgi:hypothetical protein